MFKYTVYSCKCNIYFCVCTSAVVIYRYADEQDQKYGLDKAQLVIYYHGNSEGDTQWAEKEPWLINVSYTSDNCYQVNRALKNLNQ